MSPFVWKFGVVMELSEVMFGRAFCRVVDNEFDDTRSRYNASGYFELFGLSQCWLFAELGCSTIGAGLNCSWGNGMMVHWMNRDGEHIVMDQGWSMISKVRQIGGV